MLHQAALPAPMWVSVGGYCSFLAICFCQMFICTSDKSIWTFEKPQEALPFSTPASYLQSHPMLQSGSRQLPGRQREGTSPPGQADAGCRAIPLTAKRSGLGVKRSLSSYRSASHSRVEGVPFWEGKASEEKENGETESLASLLLLLSVGLSKDF